MFKKSEIKLVETALTKHAPKNQSGGEVFLTVGQGLLMAIKACQKEGVDPSIIKNLKALYLNGLRSPGDKLVIEQIGHCLSDKLQFSITTRPTDISNDRARRYFETHIAYNMLESSAAKLDTAELQEFTAHLKENLYKHMSGTKRMEYILNGVMHASLNKYELEYAEMIHQLMNHDYHGLSAKACDNLCEIARSTILATNNTMYDKKMPADIYADGIFTMGMDGRGRSVKRGHQGNGTSFKGLIKEGTPLPIGDIAQAKTPSPFLRSSDQATFMIESQWSQHLFSRLTQIYSNGISSTTLATLRNILMQKRMGHKHHGDSFQDYMAAFASLMIFNSGGHSLFEIFEVFKLPQLGEVMQGAGIDGLLNKDELMSQWLLEDQSEAFDKAMEATLAYVDNYPPYRVGDKPSLSTSLHSQVVESDSEDFKQYLNTNILQGHASIEEMPSKALKQKARELIDQKNSSKFTALMIAAQIGKLDHVIALIDAGANPTRNMPQKGRRHGLTALELAIKSEKYPVVEYLLNNVDRLTVKKDDGARDLRDRAPALFYACRQKDMRILDLVLDSDAKLTRTDKLLALLETIKFENADGMALCLDRLIDESVSLTPSDKQILLEAVVGTGNVAMFESLMASELIKPTEELDFDQLIDIASEKYYVSMVRAILSDQYSIELGKGLLTQEKLDQLMLSAIEKGRYDSAVLAIVYGANPEQIKLNQEVVGFTVYLQTERPEYFDAFFTDKDKEIIQARQHQLENINLQSQGSVFQRFIELLVKFVSLLPGVNLGSYYDKRKEAKTRITYQVVTENPKSDIELGLSSSTQGSIDSTLASELNNHSPDCTYGKGGKMFGLFSSKSEDKYQEKAYDSDYDEGYDGEKGYTY